MTRASALPNSCSLDRVSAVHELLLILKDYHNPTISSRCAMKIDIAKAFDTVQWDFLIAVLRVMGFPAVFIKWIRICISSPSFSVQINGELAGFFSSTRGLRQGCSLSPYLFIIAMNVLSALLNKKASDGLMGFHPKCRNLGLTHLSFADDVLVFTDGTKRSIEAVVQVFDLFASMSGLCISLEKSTFFMAGMSESVREAVLSSFPFRLDHLPVRYLGLPLTTKRLTKDDYEPLLDRIRGKFKSWKVRMLSFAGRLQLLLSVISSITQFWCSAFCLPKQCLREIDSLCASFLWSGAELSSKKAKVAWADVCKPKAEGGLGLRSATEVNMVFGLKLLWRIVSSHKSLWVDWVKIYLLREGSIWLASDSVGSWNWRKILRLRHVASSFLRVEIRDGQSTSFWFDNWTSLDCLLDIAGQDGPRDFGIPLTSSVSDFGSRGWRLRNPRSPSHQLISMALQTISPPSEGAGSDMFKWKHGDDSYKAFFSSGKTWQIIRARLGMVPWSKGIWFSYSIPKHSFISWLAARNRLDTLDRISSWGIQLDLTCVLCLSSIETRSHLFFECSFARQVWRALSVGLLQSRFVYTWDSLLQLVSTNSLPPERLFLTRLAFQVAVYYVWTERNQRRHGSTPLSSTSIIKQGDKLIRLNLLALQGSYPTKFQGSLILWLSTRI